MLANQAGAARQQERSSRPERPVTGVEVPFREG